ncbi:MAG: class I SAM-dependent methyltransferase [Candidatus Omnitrophica bacterium]|nr:class I SAM-dependent methyltransferase [Candidatus Omnitrophota bacterium]
MAFIFAVGSVSPSYAQSVVPMPPPGTMVSLSKAFVPPVFKGMKVYPNQPLRFDFVIDTGRASLAQEELKSESTKLIRYFLASLTTPEKDLWVNLSPYENNRIIPENFGETEMGRDLLAEDYILKQITASIIYPEGDTGKKFWADVYKKAQEKYGTTDIPIDTFNKVWITPDEATVFVGGNTAVIKSSHLKVMLEADYLAQEKDQGTGHKAQEGTAAPESQELAKQVLREIVIPVLEKEVNEGENFAILRQIYHAMVLATWFKRNLKESLLGRLYMDQNKVKGIDLAEKGAKEEIWRQYVEAFKKGAFNYIKEEADQITGDVIPRKYFSGGFKEDSSKVNFTPADSAKKAEEIQQDQSVVAQVNLATPGNESPMAPIEKAMNVSKMAWDLNIFLQKYEFRYKNPADGKDQVFTVQLSMKGLAEKREPGVTVLQVPTYKPGKENTPLTLGVPESMTQGDWEKFVDDLEQDKLVGAEGVALIDSVRLKQGDRDNRDGFFKDLRAEISRLIKVQEAPVKDEPTEFFSRKDFAPELAMAPNEGRTIAGLDLEKAKRITDPRNQARVYDGGVEAGVIYSYVTQFPEARQQVMERILNATGKGDKLLFVGEGRGDLAFEVQNKSIDVTAVDISEENIASAKQKGVRQAIVGDAGALKFPDASFDVVVFNESVGGMDLDKAFKEAQRVLRPGGKILITAYPAEEMPDKHVAPEGSQFLYYSQGEIRSALERNGFDPASYEKQKPILADSIKDFYQVIGRPFVVALHVATAVKPGRARRMVLKALDIVRRAVTAGANNTPVEVGSLNTEMMGALRNGYITEEKVLDGFDPHNEKAFGWYGKRKAMFEARMETLKSVVLANATPEFVAHLGLEGNAPVYSQDLFSKISTKERIVLEIGAGGTTNTKALAEAKDNENALVIGADLFDDKDERAPEKYKEYARKFNEGALVAQDAQKNGRNNVGIVRGGLDLMLFLPDRSVSELVLVLPAFGILRDIVVLFREFGLASKMKPGGRLILVTPETNKAALELLKEHFKFEVKDANSEVSGVNLFKNSDYAKDQVFDNTKTFIGTLIGAPAEAAMEGADNARDSESAMKDRQAHDAWLAGVPTTKRQPSAKDIGDHVYGIHGMSNYSLEDGVLRAGTVKSAAGMPKADTYFRITTHFALGGLVQAETSRAGNNYEYAVVSPLKNLAPQLVNIFPTDTFILGNYRLKDGDFLVVPLGTQVTGLPKEVKIVYYDPKKEDLRGAVEGVIKRNKGWLIQQPETFGIGEKAVLDGEDISHPDFFKAFLHQHPQVSFGDAVRSEVGWAGSLGFIEQDLRHLIRSEYIDKRNTYSTAELKVNLILLEYHVSQVARHISEAGFSQDVLAVFQNKRQDMEKWLEILRLDIQSRVSQEAMKKADYSLKYPAGIRRVILRGKHALLKKFRLLKALLPGKSVRVAVLSDKGKGSVLNPIDYYSLFDNIPLAEVEKLLDQLGRQGAIDQARIPEFYLHYAVTRWLRIRTARAKEEGLDRILIAQLPFLKDLPYAESLNFRLHEYLDETSNRLEDALAICQIPEVVNYLNKREGMTLPLEGARTVEDFARAHPETRDFLADDNLFATPQGQLLRALEQGTPTRLPHYFSFSQVRNSAYGYARRLEDIRFMKNPMSVTGHERDWPLGMPNLYQSLRRSFKSGRSIFKELNLEEEFLRKFGEDDEAFWKSKQSIWDIYQELKQRQVKSGKKAMDEDKKKGGIDLNSKELKLSETGDKVDFSTGVDPAMIAKGIDGFVPVILSIMPLTDPQAFFASVQK